LLGAERRSAGLLEAIGSLHTAVLLLDSAGRVIDLNGPARAILARRDGLRLGPEREIELARGVGDRDLAPLFGGAGAPALANGVQRGGAITVARQGKRMPYALLVAPLCSRDFLPDHEQPAAVVFITDPETVGAPGEQALHDVYGLTPTETALAQRLTAGQSLAEAAGEMEISKNTVRTHLKRIFSKTGTGRQAELVSLLLRGAPRISA
jgi:DNA-binding CsgD family transcriptional regulator